MIGKPMASASMINVRVVLHDPLVTRHARHAGRDHQPLG